MCPGTSRDGAHITWRQAQRVLQALQVQRLERQQERLRGQRRRAQRQERVQRQAQARQQELGLRAQRLLLFYRKRPKQQQR